MPSWARKVDTYGRKRWYKEKVARSRNGEYIGNIIFNLLFLWIVNNVQEWNVGFLKDNFSVVLWILNVNIFVQIGGNVLMFISGLQAMRYFTLIITESASFVTQMVLFYIFPFDFTHFHGLWWLDLVLPFALVLGMVVSAIKVVANLWKLIFWRS